MKKSQLFYLPIKRFIGIIGSLVGTVVCFVFLWWWVIPVNAIATKGHPFFLQERYGKHKKVFKLLKFRSMKNNVDPNLAPVNIDEETRAQMETKFGRFLRKTSIDETLQLFNIFIGQMAFIGPRPGAAHNEEDLVKLREQFNPNAFEVKPGLTGLAQVKTRRSHVASSKAEFDHEYVKKLSFWLDIKIFLETIFGVFSTNKGK